MISQANRNPGHATYLSTRPVEAFRPRTNKHILKERLYIYTPQYYYITSWHKSPVKLYLRILPGKNSLKMKPFSDIIHEQGFPCRA